MAAGLTRPPAWPAAAKQDAGTRGQGDTGTLAPSAPSAAAPQDSEAPLSAEPLVAEVISIDDFTKVDLRVTRIVEAEDVPASRQALEAHLEPRRPKPANGLRGDQEGLQARATRRPAGDLRGQPGPRKMKFGTSEGMVLAAGAGGSEITCSRPTRGPSRGIASTNKV